MRFALLLILIPTIAAAASAPIAPRQTPLSAELERAQAELSAAEAEGARLEKAAANARTQAERLRAEQAAAAQQIAAAEARITAADARLRLLSAFVQSRRARLETEQQPVAALLAGLAVMAERPPLLAIADRGGTDELVKVRVLLDSTLPAIRARTFKLAQDLREGERLAQAAADARVELTRSRRSLLDRRQRFAALEQRMIKAATDAGGRALGAGDEVLAASEDVARTQEAIAAERSSRAIAALLAREGAAPARPSRGDSAASSTDLTYRLPVKAGVIDGLGSVNENGIRSRGLTFATTRGTSVSAPADGTIRFAGPFRDYDGVMIIEHGGGWTSVLINLSSPLRPGHQVKGGAPLGRALGPLLVELSKNGTHVSPALIAGSSRTLSKGDKGG